MAEGKRSAKKAKPSGEEAVLATIAEMPDADRAIGERLHAVIGDAVPELSAKLWYGQPAYAKDGKVVCFFRGADVDKESSWRSGRCTARRHSERSIWATVKWRSVPGRSSSSSTATAKSSASIRDVPSASVSRVVVPRRYLPVRSPGSSRAGGLT